MMGVVPLRDLSSVDVIKVLSSPTPPPGVAPIPNTFSKPVKNQYFQSKSCFRLGHTLAKTTKHCILQYNMGCRGHDGWASSCHVSRNWDPNRLATVPFRVPLEVRRAMIFVAPSRLCVGRENSRF